MNRRLRSDLIETYKVVNGNNSINRHLFFVTADMGLREQESMLKMKVQTRFRKSVFSNRVIN